MPWLLNSKHPLLLHLNSSRQLPSQPTAHTAVVVQPAVEAAAPPLCFRDLYWLQQARKGTGTGQLAKSATQERWKRCQEILSGILNGIPVTMADKHVLSCPCCKNCVVTYKGKILQLKKGHVCTYV